MSGLNTYEGILQRMLQIVPNNLDKREGSVIYTALAPAAIEVAQMYAELDIEKNLSFADTATGEYLTRIAAEFGVNRLPATKARRQGEFLNSENQPVMVPLGSRFSIEGLIYTAVRLIEPGVYSLECQTPGVVGNQLFGKLLPVDFVAGLAKAELTDVLIPGEDEESDQALRQRYYDNVNEPAFGGNVADYRQKLNALEGIGGTKVFPVWQGGGTVKCTLISSDFNVPSGALLDQVQTTIDPVVNQGEGVGFAPIGHQVTISGVTAREIQIETTLTLAGGMSIGQVQSEIEGVVEKYFLELRSEWANQTQLVVRVAQLDARMLTVTGVEDVEGTLLNGLAENIVLGEEEIPELGTVTLHG